MRVAQRWSGAAALVESVPVRLEADALPPRPTMPTGPIDLVVLLRTGRTTEG